MRNIQFCENFMEKMKRRYDAILSMNLLCDEEDECIIDMIQLFSKVKRCKTHEMIVNREIEGSFNILIRKYLVSEEDQFVKYFRVTPKIFYSILEYINHDITSLPYNRVLKPISSEQKLCVALRYLKIKYASFENYENNLFFKRFLATGESHTSLSFSFRISHSWVSNIIKEVFAAIKKNMFFSMALPTKQEFISIAEDFFKKWNFPNVLGCLDCKHIRIRCPNRTGSLFYNYKDFFSIVDANSKFIGLDIGSFGREGDAGIISQIFYIVSAHYSHFLLINFGRDFFQMQTRKGH